jgi:predicted RNA-binding Zn ribbon-like protein
MPGLSTMSSFVFVAGHPAIDFLNTELVLDGAPADLLASPADLARWLAEARLGRVRQALSLSALKHAKELRAATRRLLAKPRRKDLEILNAALARGRGSFQMEMKKGALRTHFHPDAADALFLIASTVADFLASEDASLVKPCQGTNCVLLFYDTTKSHTRRWCSMAACGNRMKAAAHYRRGRVSEN